MRARLGHCYLVWTSSRFACAVCLLAAWFRGCQSVADPLRPTAQVRTHELLSLEFYSNVTDVGGFHHDCKPRQVHISLHGDDDKMIVMWMTKRDKCGSSVLYHSASGLDMDRFAESAHLFARSDEGVETSVEAGDMCASPARDFDYEPLYYHSVVLTGLHAFEPYWYCPVMSKHCYRLTSARPAGSRDAFSFVMYGDMGESDHSRAKSPGADTIASAVEKAVLEHGAELVLHVGDVSYADGDPRGWTSFLDAIEPYASVVPYMVGVGNHDYDYQGPRAKDPSDSDPYHPDWGNYKADSGGECGVALFRRFDMIDQKGERRRNNHNAPFWYSFDYGSVHFVTVSAEHDIMRHSEQWNWLRADLEAVDRCATPWVVLAMHRPLYVIKPHHANRKVGDHLQAQLEDMLFKYGVDVVLSGHVHSYSRSCPVYVDSCLDHSRGGIVHAVAGSGGHKLSRIKRSQWDWVDYAEREYGYVSVTVRERDDGDSEMKLTFVTKDAGEEHDSITLTSDLRRRRTCSYCYGRSDGQAPLGVPATCGSADDLDALFALRHPPWEAATAFFSAPMSREDYAATSAEMDEASFTDDEYADIDDSTDAFDDADFTPLFRRAGDAAAATADAASLPQAQAGGAAALPSAAAATLRLARKHLVDAAR